MMNTRLPVRYLLLLLAIATDRVSYGPLVYYFTEGSFVSILTTV